jgi:hypothetical protein
VNLTLRCGNKAKGCSGYWTWYQGGTSLGYGSMSGFGNTTTKGTTTQPAAADTLYIQGSQDMCFASQFHSFSPGSAINFTVTASKKGRYESCSVSFTMQS